VNEPADSTRFVPAAGRRGFTRLYDATIALTMRESLFRGRLAAQVLEELPAEARIADVGAGTGTLAIALAAAAPTATVAGIDPDPEVVAIARAKVGAEAVEWRAGFAGDLPLADGCCDRVVMSLVLHHLDAAAKRAALAEAHRVLRDGGRIHIADWGRAQDPLMRSTFFALRLIDGFAGTRDHAAGRLPRFVEEAGFRAVERHDRLRTAWGSLELLSARRERPETSKRSRDAQPA
jgi:ubiquinone/menaquinone biosynthesis C-methylase UbiE